ncbi:MAG: hypothetical protein BWY69_01813 [Planctomycetes bacterium ADurb.Bin401]|nr:MAG: hypothetical protein BWY69_01813 [Planctomycetes bacterium ADurb.Bin401]
MKYRNKKRNGFSLAEALTALAIAAMIMVTVIGVYSSVRKTQTSIDGRLKKNFQTTEILQRIAEDIDRLAMPGSDVTVSIKNRIDIENFTVSQMIIESKFYDKDNKPQTFEKIVWQSRVSADGNELIVFRAHSGYSLEDKMLDEPKEKYEREWYIPVCSGVSYFAIEVSDGNNVTPEWVATSLPQAVKVSISFEPRSFDALGNLSVPEELIRTRTITLDRFRQIPYTFIYKEFGDMNDVDANDVNEPLDINQPQSRIPEQDESRARREERIRE